MTIHVFYSILKYQTYWELLLFWEKMFSSTYGDQHHYELILSVYHEEYRDTDTSFYF